MSAFVLEHQDYLKDLVETASVTGDEVRVAAKVKDFASQYTQDITTDIMGSVHISLQGTNPSAPSVLLSAHMDEIGLMVTFISDEGFLSVAAVGGVDAAILPGMRVDVHTQSGTYRGIVGRKPIHLIEPDERKNITPLDKLVIDLGMPSEQVQKLVRVGDLISFGVGFELFGDTMAVSKSFDDKAGVWVMSRVLELLAKAGGAQSHFYGLASTQEEIGVRGALVGAHLLNTQVALAFYVTHATDYPGIDKSKYGRISCGGGPVIARGPNINPVVFDRLCKAADDLGIAYQIEAEPGVTGTDARVLQVERGGRACGLVSVPLRYMHTPNEVLNLKDLEQCAQVIARFVSDLNETIDFIPQLTKGACV